MAFGIYDINNAYVKPRFYLAKPNKEIISRLKEVDEIAKLSVEFGKVSELNFTLPTTVNSGFQTIANPNAELIQNKYLIKMEFMKKVSWFVIEKLNKMLHQDSNSIPVTAYSLEYELNGKMILEYEKESVLPQEVLTDLLQDTPYTLRYVDPVLAGKYRSYSFTNSSRLNSLQETAKTLNGILEIDTDKEEVSLHSVENASNFTGLRLSDKNYIQSIEDNYDSETIVTRLYPIGSEDLTINSVNPLGTSYIEDFSYYLYPFQRDENRNVIQKSLYMSDSLAHAMLDYQELIDSNKSTLSNLQSEMSAMLETRDNLQATWDTASLNLDLMTDKLDIKRSLSEYVYESRSPVSFPYNLNVPVALKHYFIQARTKEAGKTANVRIQGSDYTLTNSWQSVKVDLTNSLMDKDFIVLDILSGAGATVDFYAVSITVEEFNTIGNQETLQSQYNTFILEDALKTADNNLQAQDSAIETKQNQIEAFVNTLSLENNFTPEQLLERERFVHEYFWVEENHVEAQELYNDGVKKLEEINRPSRSLNISIYNFLNSLEEADKLNWEKLVLGCRMIVDHSRFNRSTESTLMRIDYDFENDDIKLTIADTSELLSDEEKLVQLIYNSSTSVGRLDLKKSFYDDAVERSVFIETLLNQKWDATARRIVAGVDESVEIGKRGVVIRNPNFPEHMLIAQAGVLAISEDGGRSFRNALTTDGLIAEEVVGQLLIGEKLYIQDANGIITIKGNLQTIKDADGITRIELGEYEEGVYGLRVWGGSLKIIGGLPKTELNPVDVEKWDSAEENAKLYADGIRDGIDSEIADLNTSLTELNTEINTTFKDGIISEAEAKSIETYINLLNLEKVDLDKKYTTVYNDVNLVSGTPKSNLATAKTAYNVAHANLIDSINTAIADGATTVAEKDDVDAKFVLYRDKMALLTEAFENAVRVIEDTKAGRAEDNAKQYTDSQLGNYVTATLYEQDLAELQSQIDGSITSWFYNYVPTLSNLPASDWTTTELKNIHLGDLFYNETTGYVYRFVLKNSVYQWLKITDSDVTKALADAAKAQDTADQKRRTFVAQPVPPYDVGDLWVQGINGDIMRCTTAKGTGGAYSASDWVKAAKYTDDTRAIQAEVNAKSYADGLKATIDSEIDGIETSLTNLNTEINTTFKDGVVSEAEAKSISTYINTVNTEKADVDARYTTVYGDTELTGTAKTTLATKKTAYNTAHTNLINSINTAISDGKATPAEKTDVDTKFASYRTALSELSTAFENAIDTIAQAKATKALTDANTFTQGKIDLVNADVTDVSNRVNGLKNFTDTTFADGVVTRAEKEALKSNIQQLDNEKTDLDNRYTSVYNDALLEGTPKTNLLNAKNALNTAHTNLINSINTAIADSTITPVERTDVASKYTAYRTALGTFATRMEESIRAIETKKVGNLTIGGRNLIRNSKTPTNGLFWGGSSYTTVIEDGKEALRFIGAGTTYTSYRSAGASNNIPLEANTEYVYSVFVKTDTSFAVTTTFPLHWHVAWNGNNSGGFVPGTFVLDSESTVLSGAWRRIVLRFKTINEQGIVFRPFFYGQIPSGAIFYLSEFKLEKGNKVTDWSPAPEDVDSQIALVQSEVDDVESRLTSLDTEVKGSFKDGLITEAEAKAIGKYINTLNAEKIDIDARYNSVYADTNLTGTPKTNLLSAKNSYNTAHANLISGINSAIADGKTTTSESANVDSLFNTYRASLSTLSTRFEESIRAIESKKVDNVQVGGRNLVLNSANLTIDRLGYTGASGEYYAFNLGQSYVDVPDLTEITISFDLEIYVNTANPTLMVYNSNNKGPKTFDSKTLFFTAAVGTTIKERCSLVTTLRNRPDATKVDNHMEFYSTYGTSNFFKISNIKVEKGNKATDWSPAPEDVDAALDGKASNEAVETLSSEFNSSLTTATNEIRAEVSEIVSNESGAIREAFQSEIQQTAQDINLSFTQVGNRVGGVEDGLATVNSHFKFDANKMSIGKSNSPLSISISNEQMEFIDNGSVVAYVNGKLMYIESLQVLSSLIVGKHQIETYNNDITLIRHSG